MNTQPMTSTENDRELGAADALTEAKTIFFGSIPHMIVPTVDFPTGVQFDLQTGRSLLYFNIDCPLAEIFRATTLNWKEAWLLVVAHELGHMLLNQACHANGDDTSQPDAQLRAIGLNLNNPPASIASDFQKEAAIEAHCDIWLAREAVKFLGTRWPPAVKTLRDYRASASKRLGYFTGDEYATSPALDEFLRRDGALEPKAGAEIVLQESIRNTSTLKKAAVSSADAVRALRDTFGDKVKTWRKSRDADRPVSSPSQNGGPS